MESNNLHHTFDVRLLIHEDTKLAQMPRSGSVGLPGCPRSHESSDPVGLAQEGSLLQSYGPRFQLPVSAPHVPRGALLAPGNHGRAEQSRPTDTLTRKRVPCILHLQFWLALGQLLSQVGIPMWALYSQNSWVLKEHEKSHPGSPCCPAGWHLNLPEQV